MTFEDNLKEELKMSLTVAKGSFFKRPEFGHRFRELRNAIATETTRKKCEDFAREALQWLIDVGHAKAVSAVATDVGAGRFLLAVEVISAIDRTITFNRFVEVGNA